MQNFKQISMWEVCSCMCLYHIAPLAAKGAMCTFHAFDKNAIKDLQRPEKSGLQYKRVVMILGIGHECIVSNEPSFKQFSLVIKRYCPLFGDNSLYRTTNSQFYGIKKCHFCNQRIEAIV